MIRRVALVVALIVALISFARVVTPGGAAETIAVPAMVALVGIRLMGIFT